jgi:ribosomal-protein-alanine N-acetyltransferase
VVRADRGRDELIQRFTTEPATLTAGMVRRAIVDLLAAGSGSVGFLVADAVTGVRLGNIALEHENGVGEVSYWLAPGARGRGVATRALRMLSARAFGSLELTELVLWTRTDNSASRAVAERAGYRRDPTRDKRQQVKGQTWEMAGYVRRREVPLRNRPTTL